MLFRRVFLTLKEDCAGCRFQAHPGGDNPVHYQKEVKSDFWEDYAGDLRVGFLFI